MPLEEVDVIDMITKRGSDGRYGLIVTDEGVTAEPDKRLALLQRKLLTYRQAVVQGELAETCPGATSGDFFVQVICELPPTREMRNITHVLTKTQPAIEIPVVFTEFPEGSWKGVETAEEDELGMSDEMQEAVGFAFEAAAKLLADDQVPLFVFWHDGDEQKLAAITEAKDQLEVIERVTAWVNFSLISSAGFDIPRSLLTATLVGLSAGQLLKVIRRFTRQVQVIHSVEQERAQ